MAGSVGTIFCELDLDSSRYLKSQQKLLQDATTTTLSIEQNFKNLGVKSSAEMDLMRQKINNSFDMIKNSSQATANDIIRAEQAKNDQLNRLNEQQFGKQKKFIEDAKENWKAYAASIIAAGYAAKEMIDASLKMEQITSSLKAVTGSSQGAAVAFDYVRSESQRLGLNLESTGLAYAKFAAATKNTTLEGEGARKVFSGVSEAVTALKLPGESANGIFLALSQMMSKGKISAEELSGQLGERLPGAVKLTADAMGLTTQELLKQMQEGKLMSADVLPKLAEQLHKTYGSAAVEAAEGGQAAINRMNNAMFETKATVGDAIMPVFADMAKGISLLAPYITAFVGGLKMTSVELFGFVDKASTIAVSIFSGAIFGSGGFDKLKKDLSDIDDVVKDSKEQIYKDIDKVATAQEKAGEANLQMMKAQAAAAKNTSNAMTAEEKKAATARETATKQLTEAIRKSKIEVDQIGQTTFEKDMVRINAEEKEWLKKTQNDVLVAEWKAGQIILANQKQEDETFKMWRKAGEDAEAAMKAEADLGVKMTDDAIKRGDERRKAEIEIYKDLRGYETENYNATLAMIKQKETDLKALGVNEIAIAAWVAEETRKAELKKAEYSTSFFDGVKAGLEDIAAKQTSWGKVGIDTVKSFSSNASSTMGSVFFDAYKGQLKSATEYFTAFTDAIVKTFTDALAKMIVEAALSKITMSFGATWTEGAGAVLGAVGKVLGYAADWFFSDAAAADWIPGQFAKGGLINGMNPGADSYAYDMIPAMLSPGEYVMPRSAVNPETVGALEYMRQTGQKPRGYAYGGPAYDYWNADLSYLPSMDFAALIDQQQAAQAAQVVQQASFQAELGYFLSHMYDPGYLQTTTPDTWKKFAGLDITGKEITGNLGDAWTGTLNLQTPMVLGYQNGIPVYSGYPWGHLGEYYIANSDGTLTAGYGSHGGSGFMDNLLGAVLDAATAGMSSIIQGKPLLSDTGTFLTDLAPEGTWWHDVGAKYIEPFGTSLNAMKDIIDKGGSWDQVIDAIWTEMVDPASVHYYFNQLGEALPDSGKMIGSMLAMYLAPYGIGGSIAADLNGQTGLSKMFLTAVNGISTYFGGTADYSGSVSDALVGAVKSAAKKIAMKTAISQALGMAGGNEGQLGISFDGISGGEGLAASIKDFPGSVGGSFGFPAKNGLDYVPRDNFMIRAHEGEAVLTKEENKKRREGKTGGNVLHFHFPKALVVDRKAVNELAGLIYPRLNKLAAWGT